MLHSRKPVNRSNTVPRPAPVEKRAPLSISEQRLERERHWSSFVNNFTPEQHHVVFAKLTPKNKETFHREMMTILEPILREKSFLAKAAQNITEELLRDPSLTFERAITKISHLEDRYNRSKNSRGPESGQFFALMHLLPTMKKAIFQGAVASMYGQQLSEAGLSFRREWVYEFVQKITPDDITGDTAHRALVHASSTSLVRAMGEWVIQKSAAQKEGARNALLPLVKREVFAQRSRVRTELSKINNRLFPLGMSREELRPFLMRLRKAILRNNELEIDQIQREAREQAVENFILKTENYVNNIRNLFTRAGINVETREGIMRFTKLVELFSKISNPSKRAKLIRLRLLKWIPRSRETGDEKLPHNPKGTRKAAIGFRRTFAERNFNITPSERLTLLNSRIRENKISNKQRVQLVERMILTALRVPMYTRRGKIDIHVLEDQVGAKSRPELFTNALKNLIRKGKISQVSSTEYRLV